MRIDSDWETFPPKLLWKKRLGPGWSSCAVIGKCLYTQEQIGENEAVTCYNADTGDALWNHLTPGRFFEELANVGPRATPTFDNGRIYALGATGNLVCLDAITGEKIWGHDIKADADVSVPKWGFASSPLVMQGIVTVYAGGPNSKTLLGYNADSGKLIWSAGDGKNSYSSPQPAQMAGIEQLLLATQEGLASFKPATGEVLWKHDWSSEDLVRCVQPGIIDEGGVLIGTGMGYGTRKLSVRREGDRWDVSANWTTRDIKPHFNDFVVHKGHMYGFDGGFIACVDLADGKKKWKARGHGDFGYGNGQVLLLAEQDLLLILSEKGEASLVEASPAAHTELPGRFQRSEGKDLEPSGHRPRQIVRAQFGVDRLL